MMVVQIIRMQLLPTTIGVMPQPSIPQVKDSQREVLPISQMQVFEPELILTAKMDKDQVYKWIQGSVGPASHV